MTMSNTKEYYQFYYENLDKEIFQLGSGFYKQPRRSKYMRVMQTWFDRGMILSMGYQKINQDV